MATITIPPNALEVFHLTDKKVVVFDFDEVNLPEGITLVNTAPTYGITIAAIKQNGSGLLTVDNAGLMSGSRKITGRFIAAAAALGDLYSVSVVGKTSETPEQDKTYSIQIAIQ